MSPRAVTSLHSAVADERADIRRGRGLRTFGLLNRHLQCLERDERGHRKEDVYARLAQRERRLPRARIRRVSHLTTGNAKRDRNGEDKPHKAPLVKDSLDEPVFDTRVENGLSGRDILLDHRVRM
jgi:hypothetical protein